MKFAKSSRDDVGDVFCFDCDSVDEILLPALIFSKVYFAATYIFDFVELVYFNKDYFTESVVFGLRVYHIALVTAPYPISCIV